MCGSAGANYRHVGELQPDWDGHEDRGRAETLSRQASHSPGGRQVAQTAHGNDGNSLTLVQFMYCKNASVDVRYSDKCRKACCVKHCICA